MYDNVIVPFDGSLDGRVALAPAADLAWRCGARLVVVSNTGASDHASRDAIKSRAMSMSGADVDFWVDINLDLGDAVVAAAAHRSNPVICLPIRPKLGPLRRRFTLTTMAEQVFGVTSAPVLVIGPKVDVSRGLPLVDLVVSLDGSPASERILPLATAWARALKLRVHLVGVVSDRGDHSGEAAYLEEHARALTADLPDVRHEVVSAANPVAGLIGVLEAREDSLLAMSAHGKSGDKGLLGRVTQGVLGRSPRAVIVLPDEKAPVTG